MRGRRPWLPAAVAVAGAAAAAAAFLGTGSGPRPRERPDPPVAVVPAAPVPDRAPRPGTSPRRVPVAGAEGFSILLMPDGTSFMEGPDGVRKALVDALFASRPSAEELAARAASRAKAVRPPKPAGPVQLVVLDDGVVELPVAAQITLVDRDRLVAIVDGVPAVYHADGRVETRESRRPERKEKPR